MNKSRSSQLRLMTASLLVLAVATPLTWGMGGGGGRGAAPAWIEAGYDDHTNMMNQLGIKTLRPGKSGSNQVGKGFEEATANDWMPTMPEVLTMKDGTKVTTADQWPKRRAEILEDFEREVYGRVPKETPKITWTISEPAQGTQGGIATLTRRITGQVDNSAFPQITNVSVNLSFTIPANTPGPVPIVIEFGMGGGGMGGGGAMGGRGAGRGTAPASAPATAPGGAMAPSLNDTMFFAAAPAGPAAGAAPGGAGGGRAAGGAMGGAMGGGMGGMGGMGGAMGGAGGASGQSMQAGIPRGWGFGTFDTASVQADSGGNALRQGIIGLCNKGQPRKPDDWGSLRAWQWGISRLIDVFEQHPELKVDPKKVAVEGVSRFGKAAIVAEAFEPRVAVAFVASSGEGGVKLHRHDFGEAVENLTGGEYYWMAGNFMKYGAKEFTDPAKKELNASNIPVDSHELIALCAPRPCFVSQGVESAGDPKWIDAAGSMRACILATPVYELLGKKGFGDAKGDWVHAPLPAVGTLLGGDLAFRQHPGGHASGPNFPTFFDWISKYITSPATPATAPAN